jgi:arsenate reductase (thioredoxin)
VQANDKTGQPILAHWGMPDPAAVEGDEAARRAAFIDALTLISRRVDLLLALRVEKLDKLVVEAQVQTIGEVGTATSVDGEFRT